MLASFLSCALALAASDAPAGAASSTRAPPAVEPLEAPDGVKGLRATFVVAAPADAVLQALWDVRRFRSIFPDVKSLAVLAPKPDEVDAATQLDVKFVVDAVFRESTYTLRRTLDRKGRVISWTRIAGDVPVIRGSWAVTDVSSADRPMSRVTYTSFVDIGYFVPTAVVRDVAMGKVNEMAVRVRDACTPPRLAAP